MSSERLDDDGDVVMEDIRRPQRLSTGSKLWNFMGRELPRGEIVFFSQMIIIVAVITAAIYNLSTGQKDRALWITLLSSCLGYVLPNPTLERRRAFPI